MKESGQLTYGQVPALFVDGKQVNQSSSIIRVVGKLGGLYPDDIIKAALVDSLIDQVCRVAHHARPPLLALRSCG